MIEKKSISHLSEYAYQKQFSSSEHKILISLEMKFMIHLFSFLILQNDESKPWIILDNGNQREKRKSWQITFEILSLNWFLVISWLWWHTLAFYFTKVLTLIMFLWESTIFVIYGKFLCELYRLLFEEDNITVLTQFYG